LSEPPTDAGYCHCTRCQRRTGGGSSAQARIDSRTFELVRGDDLLQAWRHPEGGFEKCFCRVCGAHLFSRNPDDPAQMSVRMGAFDGDPGVRPSWRAYVAYAVPWEPIPPTGSSATRKQSPASQRRLQGPRSDLVDTSVKASTARPASASVKIVAYQKGAMSGEPSRKWPRVVRAKNA
jgi:hypothetical protein